MRVKLRCFSFWTSNFSWKAIYIETVFGSTSKCIIVEINSSVTWFPNSIKLILFIFEILPIWGMWKGTQQSAEHWYFEMCACICTTDPLLQTSPTKWDCAAELASGFLSCQNLTCVFNVCLWTTSLILEPNTYLPECIFVPTNKTLMFWEAECYRT